MVEAPKREEDAGKKPQVVKGTEGLRYWEFRKQFCSTRGWDLRRIAPQTYEVVNREGEKLGVFKSGEGYLLAP